ncbi:hypothetical protein B0H11DRAFT_2396521 [Mycena galericulata]|nr:hypothetical protein B0H11DRAFT_2396521 [Mycena galericulata]
MSRRPLYDCCGSYVRADSIPVQISLLPGAIDQILSQKSSESTSDIWGLVKGHKQNVSQHHLGVPRAQNPSLLKATASRLKGTAGIGTGITSKGQQYLQDMKDKCEQGKKVKFTISMAKSVAKKPGIVSFILIPEIRFVELVNEEEMGYDVLDSIVLKAQEYHTESYPLSGKIYRLVHYTANIDPLSSFRRNIVTFMLSSLRQISSASPLQVRPPQLGVPWTWTTEKSSHWHYSMISRDFLSGEEIHLMACRQIDCCTSLFRTGAVFSTGLVC